MIVAIDGPAGTGKSTISRCVAERTGLFYLNSGRFYRAVTWKLLKQGKGPDTPEAAIAIAADTAIEVTEKGFLVDGRRREPELHTPAVDNAVAAVSAIPEVRIAINRRLKRIAARRDVVVEGRDITTVVFPDAEIKVFLDAEPEERARRRYEESDGTQTIEEIADAIRARDAIDRTKEVGRLEQPPDAIYLDTTRLTIEQVCETVISIIQDRISQGRSI